MSAAKTDEPKLLRWTREEYYKIATTGVFDGRRVELIKGEIFEMSPQLTPHAVAVMLVDRTVRKIFSEDRYVVRVQLPLSLEPDSDPEPDIAVVEGAPRDFLDAHPSTAVLIVEVAETSLTTDRRYKASLYASVGIADYWIVNLVDRQLEVHRTPVPDPTQPYGFGYASVTTLTAAHSVSPLAVPQATMAVADLLP